MPPSTSFHTAMLPAPMPADPAARLLLFCVRRMAIGGLADAHAAAAMLGIFGRSYRRPLVLLRALMAELARTAASPIVIAPPCCPRMTAAEGLLLSAVADATHDPVAAVEAMATILGREEPLGAYSSAEAVAGAFTDLGRPLDLSVDLPAAAVPR